ncbi:putative mediator of RNA polymerase II transcription subunit 26 [Musca domestica]|uniref:Mediator of RNA polymerase II transcription subunit 26 n=1 Tax=Musca domestica TaxID=7370 RepID=A0ABM3UYL0_MUSDO|nr:putative mediator of RNA polymerase II transcription subunit 26 [Musca domestica]
MEYTHKQYNDILVVVDAFTKFVWLYPTKSTGTNEVIDKLCKQSSVFGNPQKVITDRGTAFTSKQFDEYCKTQGIQHLLISTGVPRGNGQVERMHRIIIPMLAKLCVESPGFCRSLINIYKSFNNYITNNKVTNNQQQQHMFEQQPRQHMCEQQQHMYAQQQHHMYAQHQQSHDQQQQQYEQQQLQNRNHKCQHVKQQPHQFQQINQHQQHMYAQYEKQQQNRNHRCQHQQVHQDQQNVKQQPQHF